MQPHGKNETREVAHAAIESAIAMGAANVQRCETGVDGIEHHLLCDAIAAAIKGRPEKTGIRIRIKELFRRNEWIDVVWPDVPRVGDTVYVRDDGGLLLEGLVSSVCWKNTGTGAQEALLLLKKEADVEQVKQAPDVREPVIQESSTPSIRHRIEFNGRVGFFYEYPNGKCWARIEDPDKKLGSFPDRDAAKEAVVRELGGSADG